MKVNNQLRTKWPMIRVSMKLHQKLKSSSAIESGRQKKPIRLIDWTNQIIDAGLKKLGY
jgi:hypothetical protein